jgi:hypothetical protein
VAKDAIARIIRTRAQCALSWWWLGRESIRRNTVDKHKNKVTMTFGHRTDYLFVVGCKVDGTIVGDWRQDLFIGSKKNASRMAIA